MIEARNVSKTYENGTTALRQTSIKVEHGEMAILLGHNGSGKSTLFRCLAGLEVPTEGAVYIAGTEMSGLTNRRKRPLRQKIGMVFQHFNLIPNVSIFQNVLFGALGRVPTSLHAFRMFAPKELRMEAMHCLDRVGLAHLAERRADQLSGGQQQRVAIVRMLMQQPQIILADEPIASLDPKAGRHILELLTDIAKERNLAVLAILHHLDLALEYGDRILMLREGELVVDQKSADVTPGQLEVLYESNSNEPILQKKREGA